MLDLRRYMNSPSNLTMSQEETLSNFHAAVDSVHPGITDEFSGPVSGPDIDADETDSDTSGPRW